MFPEDVQSRVDRAVEGCDAREMAAAVEAAAGMPADIRAPLLEVAGGLYVALGHTERALAAFREALSLREQADRDALGAALGLGTVLLMLGRLQEAEAVLCRFEGTGHGRGLAALAWLRRDGAPLDAAVEDRDVAMRMKAEILVSEGRHEEVVTLLSSIDAGPEGQIALARAQVEVGDLDDAEATLCRLQVEGDLAVVVLMERATVARRREQIDRAITLSAQAMERWEEESDPSLPWSVFLLLQLAALYLYDKHAPSEAIPLLEEALATSVSTFGDEHPVTGRVLLHLGHAELMAGRDDEARPLLARARALTVGREHSSASNALALIFARAGEMPRACALLEEASQLSPEAEANLKALVDASG